MLHYGYVALDGTYAVNQWLIYGDFFFSTIAKIYKSKECVLSYRHLL